MHKLNQIKKLATPDFLLLALSQDNPWRGGVWGGSVQQEKKKRNKPLIIFLLKGWKWQGGILCNNHINNAEYSFLVGFFSIGA